MTPTNPCSYWCLSTTKVLQVTNHLSVYTFEYPYVLITSTRVYSTVRPFSLRIRWHLRPTSPFGRTFSVFDERERLSNNLYYVNCLSQKKTGSYLWNRNWKKERGPRVLLIESFTNRPSTVKIEICLFIIDTSRMTNIHFDQWTQLPFSLHKRLPSHLPTKDSI